MVSAITQISGKGAKHHLMLAPFLLKYSILYIQYRVKYIGNYHYNQMETFM
jgi:hypothetical protein